MEIQLIINVQYYYKDSAFRIFSLFFEAGINLPEQETSSALKKGNTFCFIIVQITTVGFERASYMYLGCIGIPRLKICRVPFFPFFVV